MSQTTKSTAKISLCILLIGKTGHGKSATGNSILGRKEFVISSRPKSKTKEVKDAWAQHNLYDIKVIDGPGLEDTDLNETENKEQACENMAKALMMCNGGVHAFVLVIKFGERFTREEKNTISDLKQIFGENYLKNHGIIVLTRGDQFHVQMEEEGTPDKSFTEWCQEEDEYMGFLFRDCSPRIVLFNNITKSDEEKERQRNELFKHAEELSKKRGLYTSEHFKQYAHLRQELIKRSKITILQEALQRKINLLSAELGFLSQNSSMKDVEQLEAGIDDLHKEIQDQGSNLESLQDLKDDLERIRTVAQELKRAIKEKNTAQINSHVDSLQKLQKELEETRNTPWQKILVGIGAGIAVGAVIVGGAAAFSASGGSLAALAPVGRALAPMGRAMLSLAVAYIEKKMKQL